MTGRGENAPILNCIARCLSFLSVALQLDTSSIRDCSPNRPNCLFIRHNEGFKKVAASAVSYFEAASSYCEIHLTNDTVMLVSIPLSKVIKFFHPNDFIRIHRSFSINLLYVDSFIGNTLVMEGGTKLPIGREYRKMVIGNFMLVGTKSRKYAL